jgi:hypothetical protein
LAEARQELISAARRRASPAPFEELNFALVLFGRSSRVERPEVTSLSGFWVGFARIEPEPTGFQLADH